MAVLALRTRVNWILSGVVIFVFCIICLLSGFKRFDEIRAGYVVAMKARINVARAITTDVLFDTDDIIQSVLGSHSKSLEDLFSQLSTFRYFEFHGDNFYILDPQGKVLHISEPYSEYVGLDFSSMASVQSGSKRQVQHHYQSLLTKQSVVTIQYPLEDGYVLVLERSLANITPIMASFEDGQLYEGELLFVVSENGRTIYHPNHTLMVTRYNLGFDLKNITEQNIAGLFSFSYKGQKFIALRERFVEPENWIMYYCIPTSVMTGVIINAFVNQLVFLFIVCLILFTVLRVVFNRFFSLPVNNIVDALESGRQVSGSSLSPGMSGGILEFDTIIEAINSRDKEILNTVDRFQAVLDSLDAVVYVCDMQTHELLFLNSHGKKLYGDCVGKKCYKTFQKGQDGPCDFCTNHLLLDSEGEPAPTHVWELQNTRTGNWSECRDHAIRWTDGRFVRMEIATNIDDRKNAENARQAEKELLSVTLRSIGDGVITTDIKGNILFINKIAEDLSGWTNEEARGLASIDVFNIINEKTGQKCASPVQRVIELGRIIGLANHTALIAKDGTTRSIADSGAPIRDKNSNIVGVVIVFRDITHEKKIEEELLKTRKLESIGVLAGGIAHDFNNILSAVLGNIELAGYRIPKEDNRTTELLSDAEKATKRAAKLTEQLLTFSKGGEPVKETKFLPELITESANFVLHGSQVLCKYSFPEHLWMVDVDSGQIGQVIQNIIINAKHSMPAGGFITIQCANIEDTASEAFLSVDKGDYVCIRIQDTGVGIPREIIDKIFDPYFTTKQEGSGLGLAICHSIINKHGGYLTVSSVSGKGTTFTIYLPAVRSGSSHGVNTQKMKANSAVKVARIMIMDDEKMIRDLASSQLGVLGHEAILVNDGIQAINKYQELQDSGTPVDLVIMDLTIPGGMGGEQAAAKLLSIDPNAKIIVASGYSNDLVMASYRDYGFCAAIAKPFDLKQLSNTISSIFS